ncbi:hypothetical protein [Colwellia sp. PAMC 21821]|uniref:hypothetical protein n=1 Tax=Colwellia sp. PAMC 21821 TaxID=1816219 RepID=UPI0009C0CC6E|nr:hypothetical protein [Colwellia sp. PAMC 21821]ARD44449.1 hypothetical protein A3Q33_09100 [Colwellia sp. PAMC 21821]
MRLAFFIFFTLTLLSSYTLQAKEWRLAVCYGKNATEIDKKYRKVISDTAARVFATVDDDAELAFMARGCEKEPNLACYADSSAIYCREEPLALITRVSAWLAAEAAFMYLSNDKKVTVLSEVPKLSWVDALLLADAEKYDDDKVFTHREESIIARRDLSADDLNSIYSLVVDIYSHVNNAIKPDAKNIILSTAIDIYNEINDYAFSFILGHEGYHFNGNICPVMSKSVIETKNVWAEIYKLQLKPGLFDSKVTLDKHELNADLCGFKWLGMQDGNSGKANEYVLSALIKRVAIDLLAAPILTGSLNDFDVNELGDDAPKVKLVDGYLYPQSRLLLASATLNLPEKKYPAVVKICNDTAKAIVTMIQHSVQNYPKTTGDIPDSVLTQLPIGVEKAWNGGEWTDESYLCNVGGEE